MNNWEKVLKRIKVGIHKKSFSYGLERVQKNYSGKLVTGAEFYLLLKNAMQEIVDEEKGTLWEKAVTRTTVSHLAPQRLSRRSPTKLFKYCIQELGVPKENYMKERDAVYFRIPTKEEWRNDYE